MWAKAYAEDGFVIVPNLQGADTLDRLRQAMDRIMKDPKGVPEDLRHKILLGAHACGEISGVAQRHYHGDAMREITHLPLIAPKTPQQLPSQLPLNLYPCGDLGYLAVPELL